MSASLAELLREWRASRDPELADRIDRADAETPAHPIVPISASDADHFAAWRALAATADPTTLRALRRALWPRNLAGFTAAVEALLRWPHDPRVARLLAQAVRDRPVRARPTSGPLQRVLAHLQTLDDVRVLRWLPLPGRRDLEPALSAAWSWFGVRVPPPGPAPAVGPPEDPDVLAVHSDRLQESGDPQGLVWALQRAREPAARAEAARWIRRYQWSWTPAAIRGVARPGGVDLTFGRVTGVDVEIADLEGADLGGPAWAGVRELTVRGWGPPPELGGLRALRVVQLGHLPEAWRDRWRSALPMGVEGRIGRTR